VALAADETLVAVSKSGRILRWDVGTGALLGQQVGPAVNISALAVHPRDMVLSIGTSDGEILLWDLAAGAVVQEAAWHQGTVVDLAFSPDGRQVASAGDREVIVSAARGGAVLRRLAVAGHSPSCLAFSPDGRLLAIGEQESNIRIWDVSADVQVHLLTGHDRRINDVVFSRTGGRLASASDDGTVKLWDVSTGQELLTLRGVDRKISALAFSGADNEALVALMRTPAVLSQVRVWQANKNE
jgi:WD40 repeat protein